MVTQNGSGPEPEDLYLRQVFADPIGSVKKPERVFDFPDRIRFIVHTGPNSAIEGWAEFKSDRLTGYLTDKNARSLGDLVRQGARIKAHMYFEIEPDREKS